MSRTSMIILSTIIATCILLGLGYAAIQNITLNIAGTAVANADQTSFKVKFVGTPVVSNGENISASIIDDTNATIGVTGLTEAGQYITAIYEVKNESGDLSADFKVDTSNDNPEFFKISSLLAKTSLTAGETTTVLVTVELIKTPITQSESANIGVELIAMPVQPGEEGTSDVNDYSETPKTTLAAVKNANIGDYIDLGNNIVGTESTTDDWRIFYKKGNTVYAILADYLPASQVPTSEGLSTNPTAYPYSVWSDVNRDTLVNELKNETLWSGFTNGIEGAKATGAPTRDLFVNSYEIKSGKEVDDTVRAELDNSIEDCDLYVPRDELIDQCWGYWLASPNDAQAVSVQLVSFSNIINSDYFGVSNYGVRPVVALPTNINVEIVNDVWVLE